MVFISVLGFASGESELLLFYKLTCNVWFTVAESFLRNLQSIIVLCYTFNRIIVIRAFHQCARFPGFFLPVLTTWPGRCRCVRRIPGLFAWRWWLPDYTPSRKDNVPVSAIYTECRDNFRFLAKCPEELYWRLSGIPAGRYVRITDFARVAGSSWHCQYLHGQGLQDITDCLGSSSVTQYQCLADTGGNEIHQGFPETVCIRIIAA